MGQQSRWRRRRQAAAVAAVAAGCAPTLVAPSTAPSRPIAPGRATWEARPSLVRARRQRVLATARRMAGWVAIWGVEELDKTIQHCNAPWMGPQCHALQAFGRGLSIVVLDALHIRDR